LNLYAVSYTHLGWPEFTENPVFKELWE